jgi:hypothetical protein
MPAGMTGISAQSISEPGPDSALGLIRLGGVSLGNVQPFL